jgi:GNAT superfamily N-acetyltransferase
VSTDFRTRPRDVDAIIEIMRSYYAEEGYSFVQTEARDAALDLIRHDRFGRLWVACDQGSVVGYLSVTLGFSLEYQGRDAFIDELFILKDHRGKGLGIEAIRTAEAYCRSLGVKALHLEVEHHRERAREVYQRAGFERKQRYLMTKRLSG